MKNKTEKSRTRHGGAYDRGSADKYYSRPFEPHYYVGGTATSERVHLDDLTPQQVKEYTDGWNQETQTKEY